MAKAKKKSGEVVLRMSEVEAQVLTNVLARVGGDPKKSRRRYVNSIYNVLKEAGIYYESSSCPGECDNCLPELDVTGSITFH